MRICFICARKGSVGVPKKHLLIVNSKTLLENTIEQAFESKLFDHIIFSSNDLELIEISRFYKNLFIVKRPENLSNSLSSKWDVFKHSLSVFERETGMLVHDDTLLCDLDVSVPFRSLDDLFGIVNSFINRTVWITAFNSERNPYFNMVELKDKDFFEIVSKSNLAVQNRQEANEVFSLSSSVFCFDKYTLFNSNHWSNNPIQIFKIPRKRGFDLDNFEDYEYFKLLNNG